MEKYSVRLACFEGPMDLLMHLIEKNKIDIYDIPIAVLTSQYMEYIHQSREFHMDLASEFLLMAATLLQIKSRMLLPKVIKEKEETVDEDPRQELVDRLLEYKRFKGVSSLLEEMQEKAFKCYTRQGNEIAIKELPPGEMPLSSLLQAFSVVLRAKRAESKPEAVVEPEAFNVEDKMDAILVLLEQKQAEVPFEDIFLSHKRAELIVTFLAMLELIRLKLISVIQRQNCGEIYISMKAGDR